MHVLNLNSALYYPLDEKMIDIGNREVFSLPLKLGQLAICINDDCCHGREEIVINFSLIGLCADSGFFCYLYSI